MNRFCLFLVVSVACCVHPAIAGSRSEGPAVGSEAPDFKSRNLVSGETITLNSQRGKVVILTFWASWCGPCRRELPLLERAQELVGKESLTVLAVSFKENPEAASAIKKQASTWRINVIQDPNGWIANHYSISSIPHLFIIGRDGTVLANHLGYGDRTLQELVHDINHALAPSADAPDSHPKTAAR